MIASAWVALGGALGSVARFKPVGWAFQSYPDRRFRIGTFAVNVLGCRSFGALAWLRHRHAHGKMTPGCRWYARAEARAPAGTTTAARRSAGPYLSKRAHGKAVPTWNYAVVHAHGMPNAIEDREWLLRHVNQLTDMQESQQAVPWKVSDAPPDYIDTMLRSIVGIEMPISSLAGKWKLSQNRPPADKPGIIAGLLEREDAQSKEIAALVRQRVNRELAE